MAGEWRRVAFAAVMTTLGTVLACGSIATAQETNWPARPVRLIVNYGPGGSSDNSIRPFQQPLSAALGQQFVIDNKGGAAGAIGVETVVKSPADGYTFLVTPVAAVMILPQVRKTPYDPFKDLVPVIRHGDSIGPLTAHPSLGVSSIPELQALAKKQPGKISFGGVGLGTSTQLTALMLNQSMGVDILYVPYRGAGEALPDMLSGVVQLMVDPSALPHAAAGKLKLLAVSDRVRHPDFPDVPTVREIYPDLTTISWFGVFAPAGTPAPIVRKMNEAMGKIARTPEIQATMLKYATRAAANTPEEFAAELKRDWVEYGALIKKYNITLD
jgi:tripartite-type tricarboxylate transporter receptor subunit TctC